MSAVSKMSLMPNGTPPINVFRPVLSRSRALANAESLARWLHARTTGSRSAIRSRQLRTTASAVSSPLSRRRTKLVAERRCGSTFGMNTPRAGIGSAFSHSGTPSACRNCRRMFARSAEMSDNSVHPVAMMSQAATPPDFPVPPLRAGNYSAEILAGPRGPVGVYHFAFEERRGRRLLVMKLDHYGDFLIGLPALQKLRGAFRADHITLVCG